MGPIVRVDGHLDTPIYRWPLNLGIALSLLAPITYGLEVGRWRGVGRFRPIVRLLRWIGPVWLLLGGLASLLFAMGVRMALLARRRDLEVGANGFTVTDRLNSRDYDDSQVVALGFRTFAVLDGGTVARRGEATLWLETREGEERVELSWRFADGDLDPLAGMLHRQLDQLHDRATREVVAGGTLTGDGWSLSRDGLSRGLDSFDSLPFDTMAKVEYLDAHLGIWEPGREKPTFRIPEGSRNVAILHALLVERVGTDPQVSRPDEPPGLGRLLFERRISTWNRLGLWLVFGIMALSMFWVANRARMRARSPLMPMAFAVIGCGLLASAMAAQVTVFRFHDRGVSRSGLLGTRALPFQDLAEVKVVPQPRSRRWKITFQPIKSRGGQPVILITSFADEAMATIGRYALVGQDRG